MKNHLSIQHVILDPSLTAAITGLLVKRGYLGDRLEDALATVRALVLDAREGLPPLAGLDEWTALATKIARDFVVDEHRHKCVQAKYDEGLCETPDEHAGPEPSATARDPVDAERQLAVLRAMFDAGEMPCDGERILEGVGEGLTLVAIGRELGVHPKRVQKRLLSMRERYFRRLASLGMLTLIAVLFALVGRPRGLALRPAAPSSSPELMVETRPQRAVADAMRREALKACEAQLWSECVRKLDDARAIDPQGDATREVQEARARANDFPGLMPDMAEPR